MKQYAHYYNRWVTITLGMALASAVGVGYVFYDRLSSLRAERVHLYRTVVEATIEKDYSRITEELYLKLDTVEKRQRHFRSLIGDAGDVTVAFEPKTAVIDVRPAPATRDRITVREANDVVSIEAQMFFDILYLGVLKVDLDFSKHTNLVELKGLAASIGFMSLALILLWGGALYVLKKIVFVPLMEALRAESEAVAMGAVAQQVAHDIRSPLSALDVVLGSADALPEDMRVMARSAITRIKDIANNLIEKNRPTGSNASSVPGESVKLDPLKFETHLISSVLDTVVSEKRVQYRPLLNVQLDYIADPKTYGLFARISDVELKRVLSNLINNAVEALPHQKGRVRVTLSPVDDLVVIAVNDNGKGIPASLLPQIGERGKSFGKGGSGSGLGLGVFHARGAVASMGGRLDVTSREGQGTTVSIELPRAQAPKWFVDRIRVWPNTRIMIVDDDASIHQVWSGRLQTLSLREMSIEVLHTSSPADLVDWAKAQSRIDDVNFLVDFEFIGHKTSGLELIKDMRIVDRSILVTSRYDDPAICGEVERIGARMIPKGMAGIVPIEVQGASRRDSVVLIDDDALVRMNWSAAAKRAGKTLKAYSDAAAFFADLDAGAIPTDTPIYIDSNLSDGVKGEDVAREIRRRGFSEIRLATGHDPASFPAMPHIREVVGKTPPWEQSRRN